MTFDLSFIQNQLIFIFLKKAKIQLERSMKSVLFKTITAKIILILSQNVASFKLKNGTSLNTHL